MNVPEQLGVTVQEKAAHPESSAEWLPTHSALQPLEL